MLKDLVYSKSKLTKTKNNTLLVDLFVLSYSHSFFSFSCSSSYLRLYILELFSHALWYNSPSLSFFFITQTVWKRNLNYIIRVSIFDQSIAFEYLIGQQREEKEMIRRTKWYIYFSFSIHSYCAHPFNRYPKNESTHKSHFTSCLFR